MNVLRFIIENWDSVLIILSFIGGAIMLYARGETKVLSEILFRMVTEAERQFGGETKVLSEILFRMVTEAERQFGIGTGELKHAAVLEWAYDKIPSILKLIITQKRLGEMIEEALAYAKTRWAKNPRLAGYIEEKPPDNT